MFIFDKILAFLYISYLFYIFCLLGKKVMKYKPNVRSIYVYNDICLRSISVFLVHFECTLTCNESMFVLSLGFPFIFCFVCLLHNILKTTCINTQCNSKLFYIPSRIISLRADEITVNVQSKPSGSFAKNQIMTFNININIHRLACSLS